MCIKYFKTLLVIENIHEMSALSTVRMKGLWETPDNWMHLSLLSGLLFTAALGAPGWCLPPQAACPCCQVRVGVQCTQLPWSSCSFISSWQEHFCQQSYTNSIFNIHQSQCYCWFNSRGGQHCALSAADREFPFVRMADQSLDPWSWD